MEWEDEDKNRIDFVKMYEDNEDIIAMELYIVSVEIVNLKNTILL